MREADTGALLAKAAAARARRAAQNRHTDRPVRSAPKPATPDHPAWDGDDSLDDVEDTAVDEAASTDYMMSIVQNMPILDAYRRYVDKPLPAREPDERGELTVRCPLPGHEDRNPSANINTRDNVFVCYACNEGGDPLVMIGRILGLDHRNPQEFMELSKTVCEDLGYEFYTDTFGHRRIIPPGSNPRPERQPAVKPEEVPVHGDGTGLDDMFDPEQALADGTIGRRKDADMSVPDWDHLDSLGEVGGPAGRETAVSKALQAKKQHVSEAETTVKAAETAVKQPEKGEKSSKGVDFGRFRSNPFVKAFTGPEKRTETPVSDENEPETDENDENDTDTADSAPEPATPAHVPSLDWRSIIPHGTFIRNYCEYATKDDVVEEFHFWNAVTLIGLACQRDLMLWDNPPVYGNLFLCSVASTGTKKSKANELFRRVLSNASLLRPDDDTGEGVRLMPKPNSGESLLDMFVCEVVTDPSTTPPTKATRPVRGVMQISELSSLLKSAARQGSTLEPMLIQMFDCQEEVTSVSRGSGTTRAKQPFLSVNSAVQPDLVRKLVTRDMTDSGFANRFIWVYGPGKKRFAIDNPNVYGDAARNLGRQLDDIRRHVTSAGVRDGRFEGKLLGWDPEAMNLYVRFHTDTLDPAWQKMRGGDPAIRIELFMKKLILLFSVNMQKPTVPVEAVEQAIAVFPYLVDTFAAVGSNLATNERREAEQHVVDAISTLTAELKRPPSISDMWEKRFKTSTLVESREHLQKLLMALLSTDVIEEIPTKRGVRGRPTKRYRLTKG